MPAAPRARSTGPPPIAVVLFAVTTYIYTDIGTKIGINPGIIPIASVGVLLFTIYFINQRREGWAFTFYRLCTSC